jgi:hypothetical protein
VYVGFALDFFAAGLRGARTFFACGFARGFGRGFGSGVSAVVFFVVAMASTVPVLWLLRQSNRDEMTLVEPWGLPRFL